MKISASWLYQRAMLCAVLISLSLTSSAQEDYADTTETGSKSYVDVNFESLLDSISALELETGEEINRFLEEAVPGRLYMRHDYAALMNSLAWLVGELFDCGTDVVTFDGHDYSTVEIGSQCWFAENLRTTVYSDGTAIPEVTDGTAWAGLSTGARSDYDNDANNVATYGRLYNRHAVTAAAELCPSDWRVPTDAEWTALETYLGTNGHSGTEGTALKSTSGWSFSGNGTDDFGFSALPGGRRNNSDGSFSTAGEVGRWWSASPHWGTGWARGLNYGNSDVGRSNFSPRFGFSVRCLRDADFTEVQGCTDSDACNYNATANLDDSSCTYATTWYIDADGDGLGESGTSQSACNQPNGFVADSSDNCDNMTATNYNDAGNVACEYPVCGTPVVTFDNYDYTTIAIGDDCWFAENLRTTIYEDGSPVSYSNYNDDPGIVDTYGRLYNWHHHTSLNNLCPTGWHFSKHEDWEDMFIELGGLNHPEAGGKLKESGTAHWTAPNTSASNESGFTALPGGTETNGIFSGLGTVGHFWTSISASAGSAVGYVLNYDSGAITLAVSSQTDIRCSVRCVED